MPCLNDEYKPVTPLSVSIAAGGGKPVATVRAITMVQKSLSVRDASVENDYGILAACQAFAAATQTSPLLMTATAAGGFKLLVIRVIRDTKPNSRGVPVMHRITKGYELATFAHSHSNDVQLARAAVRNLAKFLNGEVGEDKWEVVQIAVEEDKRPVMAIAAK